MTARSSCVAQPQGSDRNIDFRLRHSRLLQHKAHRTHLTGAIAQQPPAPRIAVGEKQSLTAKALMINAQNTTNVCRAR